MNSYNIGNNHKLLLAKLRLRIQTHKSQKPEYQEKLNIESLEDESIRELYKRRLEEHIKENTALSEEDLDTQWHKTKTNILNAAREAVGTRKTNTTQQSRHRTPWFCEEIKQLARLKKGAFLNYKSIETDEEYKEYKTTRNMVNTKIRYIKSDYWEKYTNQFQRDLYGQKKQIYVEDDQRSKKRDKRPYTIDKNQRRMGGLLSSII